MHNSTRHVPTAPISATCMRCVLVWRTVWQTLAFVAIYAARLGATGFQISLLTAGPAVVNLFFSLPAGRCWRAGL